MVGIVDGFAGRCGYGSAGNRVMAFRDRGHGARFRTIYAAWNRTVADWI
jgi:hypothetical protein